jgi:hypothetical protein
VESTESNSSAQNITVRLKYAIRSRCGTSPLGSRAESRTSRPVTGSSQIIGARN